MQVRGDRKYLYSAPELNFAVARRIFVYKILTADLTELNVTNS